ncbi:outer member lipoprotein TUL4/LpnA [Francisella philomiragia]|uniref:outer member lipoprotein TUL4/LpnA n=1 Tax=Francisella philomiragia TaxID=28110 RepID=UPI00224311B2|nr:TUL4 family lipoprotein [Francisella philomiragia]
MKKIIKLSLLSLSIAGLASCSTVSGDKSAAQDQAPQASDATAVQASASTAPTAKIKLKKTNQDDIKATIYTTYNNNPQGSVRLQWQAPEGSKCHDTSFPITKYAEKNDKTWATVEIKQGNKYCSGKWTANVLFDKQVIASDSITV